MMKKYLKNLNIKKFMTSWLKTILFMTSSLVLDKNALFTIS